MPLPPKGDPRRDLALAIRTGWVLSTLFIFVCVIVMLAISFIATRGGASALPVAIAGTIIVFEMLCLLIPTIFLTQRKKWAAIVLIVVASFGILGGVANLIGGLSNRNPALIIFSLLIVLAMIQFIMYLSKAGKGIDYENMLKQNQSYGFTPIMPNVVPPSFPPPPHLPPVEEQ